MYKTIPNYSIDRNETDPGKEEETSESRENKVEVPDCSKRLLLFFLEHLYNGEVSIGMDDAVDLCTLSHRYQEDGLSRQCLEVVERGLTHTNATELLVDADGLGLVALKGICMEYVISNYGRIENEGITSLSRSLMKELLHTIRERYF